MKISDARFFKSPPIFENSILKALGGFQLRIILLNFFGIPDSFFYLSLKKTMTYLNDFHT